MYFQKKDDDELGYVSGMTNPPLTEKQKKSEHSYSKIK